jgi:hypothetical protein
MANSLNKNLHIGDVVVAKRKYVKDSVKDLRMVVRVETFGAQSNTMGSALGVTWMEDGTEDRWDGHWLDPKSSETAQADIYTDPTYGWLFSIIKNMQTVRESQARRIFQLQNTINDLTTLIKKNARTRVIAVYSNVLSQNDKFEVYVVRTDGSIRSYHVSRELNNWLFSHLMSDVKSAVWGDGTKVNQNGVVRLYP